MDHWEASESIKPRPMLFSWLNGAKISEAGSLQGYKRTLEDHKDARQLLKN